MCDALLPFAAGRRAGRRATEGVRKRRFFAQQLHWRNSLRNASIIFLVVSIFELHVGRGPLALNAAAQIPIPSLFVSL